MPITLDFTCKLVLVTGGGRGIGLAISKALAEYGKKIRAFKCEVTKSNEVDALVEQVRKEYNREIDIGVANAGISLWKDAHENTDEDFQSIFAVNTFGSYYLSRALIRSWLGLPVSANSASDPIDIASMRNVDLKKQILFVSSISALSLAGEWSHIGVAANSVSPGYVSTDMIANPPDATASNWVKEWEKRTPVGRFATADEIGGFIATLLSDKMGGMGFMTGSDVVVDGGE
ncbi:cytoplasmic protein [Cryptococcus gattii E566]|uniref:2,4-dienoyl-CoA reductase (NADPH), putative n=2 Tax=Cryptococcus gattii TaxID=37769 RepID=E6REE9_CRYGW|nr:2,4-dienoyl-CoA reductase (NADPH), putative [Cryptococcus gattii WM276]ADV25346.1 2,4-dienoyl-CoA reductase (NADPH), putative [Cryptococcus gattii WM276]KIR76508.1 cytoplasmic protein [Cryptococcus gattii EJB2]KIY32047.1 cytoplasmic protein [Cryptococcus gattii E566]KJE02483.1 cytoplasmic protein [Cryptococcus gattii NT-10]